MTRPILTGLLLAMLVSVPALAVEEAWTEPAADDPLLSIRTSIDAGDYAGAIAALEPLADQPGAVAEVFNLLGFSLRKSGDFAGAEEAYGLALAIDPNHLGANEYLGELYVETGRISEAQGQLMILEAACGTSCAEYAALSAFIAAAPVTPN